MASTGGRGFTPEDIYRLNTPSDPRISPDGKRVAYVVSRNDRESDEARTAIYVAPLDGRTAARHITYGDKDSSPRWSPDGRYLAFVGNRGQENQIFVLPLDGGEARQLTKAKYGVSEPEWSPDGGHIAYVSKTGDWKDPKDRTPIERNASRLVRDLYYKMDGVGQFDERRSHIFTVDLESGAETQVTDGDWNDSTPSWSPDGRTIAFVSDREDDRFQRPWRSDVWAVSLGEGQARRLTRARGAAASPRFSPDGRFVAFVGHEHGDENFGRNSHLLVIPAEGGSPRSLSEPLDRPAVGNFAWSPDGAHVLFLVADRGRQSLYRAGMANGSASLVVGGERQLQAFDLSADGSKVAFVAAWIDAPAEVYAASLAGGRERSLSRANADLLAEVEPGRAETFTFQANDGLEIETFVAYPPGHRPEQRLPMMLSIHGGPHGAHPFAFGLQVQALAAAGFAVLMPNPRGSSSYGETFAQACLHDWGGADFQDLMGAVDEMIRRGVADPDRLYVGGYSYGGYMTTWTVGHTKRFRAAYVGAPVSDLVSFFGTADIPLFARHEIGGWPWETPEAFRLHSPLTHLTNCQTPVLLIHREGDLRCPIAQSEQIFQTLKALRREVEFVRYPGGSHGVASPSQSLDQMQRIQAWYQAHAPAGEAPATKKRAKAAAATGSGSRG